MDSDMVNLASFIKTELEKMCIKDKQLYVSGNMQASMAVVAVNEEYVDVVIATDYASFTNTRGRMAGWIERTVDRCCRCYAENNNVDSEYLNGMVSYF